MSMLMLTACCFFKSSNSSIKLYNIVLVLPNIKIVLEPRAQHKFNVVSVLGFTVQGITQSPFKSASSQGPLNSHGGVD